MVLVVCVVDSWSIRSESRVVGLVLRVIVQLRQLEDSFDVLEFSRYSHFLVVWDIVKMISVQKCSSRSCVVQHLVDGTYQFLGLINVY